MHNTKASPSLRLLYLPNEMQEGDQCGARAAFEKMLADETLSGYQAYSILVETRRIGSVKALARLTEIAEEFQPDVIFWQHVASYELDSQSLDRLLELPSRPMLVYHEGDVYGPIHKRPTRAMRMLASRAQLVFVVGLGSNADLFRKMGAGRVIFVSHSADEVRFGKPWDPNDSSRGGVVMIANRIPSRIPWLSMPGALNRKELAVRLYQRLGKRFIVYGHGWDRYPFWQGPVPYDQQESRLRQHLLSVGWNHFDQEGFYYSDRLPISLLAGVAHATNYQPGYELLFQNGEQLAYFHNVKDAVDLVDWMLCQPRSYLVEMGLKGQALARQRLTSDIVYRNIINIVRENRVQACSEPGAIRRSGNGKT